MITKRLKSQIVVFMGKSWEKRVLPFKEKKYYFVKFILSLAIRVPCNITKPPTLFLTQVLF